VNEISTGMSVFLILTILVFIGIVAYYSMSTNKRDSNHRAEVASSLGFRPTSGESYNILMQRLAEINPRLGRSYMELHNVFTKDIPEGSLFLYDMWNTSGEKNSIVHNQALALIVPQLAIPRFVISSKMMSRGVIATLANNIFTWVFQNTMPIVDFPDYPEFNSHFTIASSDAAAFRNILDHCAVEQLRMHGDLFLAGGKDTMLFSPMVTRLRGVKRDTDLNDRINAGLDIIRAILDSIYRQKS
jgi:hypothetical protein